MAFGPSMAVHRHHLPNAAGGPAFLDERPDRAVTRVPRRLVVDEDVDPAAVGGTPDPLRVRVADGQRFLHHHVDAARRGRLDDGGMIEGVGERRDRLRLRAIEHGGEVGEQHGVGEAVPLRVLLPEGRVGVEDADDLDVLARLRGLEESGHVAVHETGDREPERRGRRRRCCACAGNSAARTQAIARAGNNSRFMTSFYPASNQRHARTSTPGPRCRSTRDCRLRRAAKPASARRPLSTITAHVASVGTGGGVQPPARARGEGDVVGVQRHRAVSRQRSPADDVRAGGQGDAR